MANGWEKHKGGRKAARKAAVTGRTEVKHPKAGDYTKLHGTKSISKTGKAHKKVTKSFKGTAKKPGNRRS